jgi:1-pyrroline-5-carboxylate dehydrogenase
MLQRSYDEAAERVKDRARQGKTRSSSTAMNDGGRIATSEPSHRRIAGDRQLLAGHGPRTWTMPFGAAKDFSLEWDRMGWQERVRILRNVADIMEDRLFDLAALMAYEVGKSRLEALGDVQETAELIRWNCDEVEKHDGFRTPMSGLGAAGDYYDVMRPYGRMGLDQPVQLPDGALRRALVRRAVAGNCVVLKPVEPGRVARIQALRVLPRRRRAGRGVPSGRGEAWVRGEALLEAPDVGGITFTGSYNVGMDSTRTSR